MGGLRSDHRHGVMRAVACGQAQERSGGTCFEQKERNGASTRNHQHIARVC